MSVFPFQIGNVNFVKSDVENYDKKLSILLLHVLQTNDISVLTTSLLNSDFLERALPILKLLGFSLKSSFFWIRSLHIVISGPLPQKCVYCNCSIAVMKDYGNKLKQRDCCCCCCFKKILVMSVLISTPINWFISLSIFRVFITTRVILIV